MAALQEKNTFAFTYVLEELLADESDENDDDDEDMVLSTLVNLTNEGMLSVI